jgi:hypothetical protein
VADENSAASSSSTPSFSTPVSSSDYVRVSARLKGVTISFEEFEAIKSVPLFDDRQVQERINAGSAYGRFESAKERKHCVVGLEKLSPSSQEKIKSELQQRPNVVPTFLPGTPSPRKSAPPKHIWTPSHTTKLEESSTFTIGKIKISVFIDKNNMKRAIGFVSSKNLMATFDSLAQNSGQDLSTKLPDTTENKESKENKTTTPALNEGTATFSAEKYNRSYKYSIEKQSRSQVGIKKMTAGAFLESKGYENVIGGDGKSEAEWLDGLSRDLLRRAATSIVVNNIPCKLVPKNLNLVALADGETVCTNSILFAGTRGSNTHMMIAEGIVRLLLRKGTDVTVRYEYIDDREMYYYIDTDKTETIRFKFDTQKYDSPTTLEQKLIATVIDEIVNSARQQLSTPSPSPPSP